MSDDRQAAIDATIAAILSRDAPPYQPKPGDPSLLAGPNKGFGLLPRTRIEKLCEPIRLETIAWLGTVLACAAGRPIDDGVQAVFDAILEGEEESLDNDTDYIFAFDIAAYRLGVDPFAVSLRPAVLDS